MLDVTVNLLPLAPEAQPFAPCLCALGLEVRRADVTHLVALSVHQLLPVPLTFIHLRLRLTEPVYVGYSFVHSESVYVVNLPDPGF